MKFLVIGLGSMGKRRIRNLLSLGEKRAEIFGFDPRKDRQKETTKLYGVKAFDVFEQGMAEDPDVLIISSPPHLHLQYAFVAIEHNKHFFTELNLPQKMADYTKMIRHLEKKKKIIGAPSCSLYYHPCIKKMKELLDKGAIGKVLLINYHSGQWLGDWHPWEKVTDFFVAGKKTGGGRELALFELNWIRWIMNEIKSVTDLVKKLSSLPISAYDNYSMLLEFKNGAVGNILLETIQRDHNRVCKLISEKSSIIWDWKARSVKLYKGGSKTWKEFPESSGYAGYSIEQMYIDEIDHFLKAIYGKTKYQMSFKDEKRLIEIILAAEKSSKEKRRVELL